MQALSAARAILGLLGLGFCLLLLIPFQLVLNPKGGPAATVGPKRFFAALCRLFGVRVHTQGEMIEGMPALYVANHMSWLDIMVLGSLIPGSFVARGDLEQWPFFGWASTLQRTIFIDRHNKNSSGDQLSQLSDRLEAGDNLILFPEGTSSEGTTLLPFKSSLFAVAERWTGDEPLMIQPISLAYTHLNNIPLTRHFRPYVAWIGDMELPSHVWALMRLGFVTASVTFHEPIASDSLPSRKVLSNQCSELILQGVQQKNGHYPDMDLETEEAA